MLFEVTWNKEVIEFENFLRMWIEDSLWEN